MGNCMKPKKPDENPEDQPGDDQGGGSGEPEEDGAAADSQDAEQSNTSAARQSRASSSQLDVDAGKQPEAIWVSNPNIEGVNEAGSKASRGSIVKGSDSSAARKSSRLSFNLADDQNPSSLRSSVSGRPAKTSRNSSISKKSSPVNNASRSGSFKTKMNVDCATILSKRTSNALPSTSTYLRCYNGNKSTESRGVTCEMLASAMDCGREKMNYDPCSQLPSYSGYNNHRANGCCHGYNPELSTVRGAERFSVMRRCDADGHPQVNGRFSRASTTTCNHNNQEIRDRIKGTRNIQQNAEDSGWATENDTPSEVAYKSNCDLTQEIRSKSAYVLDCPSKSDASTET